MTGLFRIAHSIHHVAYPCCSLFFAYVSAVGILEVHFGGLWAPGLLTIVLQGGLRLESYVAGSYVNFGSCGVHLDGGGGSPPRPVRIWAGRDYRFKT